MYNVISEINKLEEKYGEEFNWGTDLKPEYFEAERHEGKGGTEKERADWLLQRRRQR